MAGIVSKLYFKSLNGLLTCLVVNSLELHVAWKAEVISDIRYNRLNLFTGYSG